MTPEEALDRLVGMGYFKFLSRSEHRIAKQELVAAVGHGYLGTEWDKNCVSRDKRTYPADSEELAEGSTGKIILLMQDVLSHEGVPLHSVEDDFQDEKYDVVIDGRRYPIHGTNILATWGSWTIAAKRLLEIVSGLLRAAGSNEQLYGIYGGNDGRAILLTAGMYDLVKSSGIITDLREMPHPASAINTDGTIRDLLPDSS
jgi:hypothetical protein